MKKLIAAAMLISLFSPMAVLADSVIGSAGAGWQTWSTGALSQTGTPYWNGNSTDGSNMGIGYCISGTGNCGMAGAPGVIPYWGNADGSADPNITFATHGAVVATFELGIGWYTRDGSNTFGYSDLSGNHALFSGVQTGGATVAFTPNGSYSFFLISGDGFTYNTDSALSSMYAGTSVQHFAIFTAGGGSYYIGAEDEGDQWWKGDNDYNDFVVKISSTPEPSSLVLLAAGVLAMISRRRPSASRNAKKPV
ncbi:MAG: PEP-CTERM sorting domain-containing protein [Terriglobales bacterium]